jgi:hypothetical protein
MVYGQASLAMAHVTWADVAMECRGNYKTAFTQVMGIICAGSDEDVKYKP